MMPRSTPDIRRVSQPSLQAVVDSVARPFVYQRHASSAVPVFERKGASPKINSGSIPPAFHYQSGPFSSDDRSDYVEEGFQSDTEYPGEDRFSASDISQIAKGVSFNRNDRKLSDPQTNHDRADILHESINRTVSGTSTNHGETVVFQQIKDGSFQKNFDDSMNGRAVVPLSSKAPYEKRMESPDGVAAKKASNRNEVFEESLEENTTHHKAMPKGGGREDKMTKVSHTLREAVAWIEKDPAWHGEVAGKESPVLSESVLSPLSLSDISKKEPTIKNAALRSVVVSPTGNFQKPLEPKRQTNIGLGRPNLTYLQRSVEGPLSPGRQKGSDSETKQENRQGNESPVKEKIVREIIRVRAPSSNNNQVTRGFAQRSYLVRLLRFRGV